MENIEDMVRAGKDIFGISEHNGNNDDTAKMEKIRKNALEWLRFYLWLHLHTTTTQLRANFRTYSSSKRRSELAGNLNVLSIRASALRVQ